jgi:hypothetical protein
MLTLLSAAGLSVTEEIDFTREFSTVLQAWIHQWELHREGVEATWGSDVVAERQKDRRGMLRMAEEGILRRTMFVARRTT